MLDYVTINGKKYRKGYTTGSCAAAAGKAAVIMLASRKPTEYVSIDTPAGVRLDLPVSDICIDRDSVKCSVIKDGGDDPDVTTGLKIFAQARFTKECGIAISAGEGIGMVTLQGLKVEPGKPAINPVPMQMILKEVGEVLVDGRGVEITFSVPGGAEAAEKTYNPKLGIIGGISILGTTGIVSPMSEDAWKESLSLELDILSAKGTKCAVYTFGNYGEKFTISKLGIKNNIVKVSNFVGFMLDRAAEKHMEELLLIGHLGKLVKVAAGIFHTHSRVADARMEIMAAYAALEGASSEVVKNIFDCRTTEAAAVIINSNGLMGVYDRIVSNSSKRCMEYVFGKIKIGTVLFNESDTLITMDEVAKEILLEMRKDYE